ncbi:MAG: PKD domain-containing protein [Planctomycetaceae bacterium]
MRLAAQALEPRLALAGDAAVTAVLVPPAGTAKAGDELSFTVRFDKPVVVEGTPQLGLVIGAARRPADHVPGQDPLTLRFRYVVKPGDRDVDGIGLVGRISLPAGAAIRDKASGNALRPVFTPPSTAQARVDGVRPGIVAVAGPAPGILPEGAVLSLAVSTGERVFVTGKPTLPVEIGGIVQAATLVGNAEGTSRLTFQTTVQRGSVDIDGVRVAGPIDLPAGSAIRDAAGNDLDPTVPRKWRSLPNRGVDGIAPHVVAIAAPQISPRGTVSVQATFSEAVRVKGVPTIPFSLGERQRELVYAGGAGGRSLTFTYRPVKGEVPTGQNVFVSDTITLPRGAGITDRPGNPAGSLGRPNPGMVPRLEGIGAGGAIVGFPVTLSLAGARIHDATWEFRDKAFPSTATGLTPEVVFRQPGTFTVTVTARGETGIAVTENVSVTVADVPVTARAPTATVPYHNVSEVDLEMRADGRRVFLFVSRRLPDSTLPARLAEERGDGTFALTTVLPPGATDISNVRLVLGADGVPRMLLRQGTSAWLCTRTEAGLRFVHLGDDVTHADIALRPDDRPVVSLARGRWLAPATGGLRLLSATNAAPGSLADFGPEVIVDTRAYLLPVDVGSSHALTMVGDRPVIVGNNGLFVGRYPDGSVISPIQAWEATVADPRSSTDFTVHDVDSSVQSLRGIRARVMDGRLWVAGVARDSFVAYHAGAAALGSGFMRVGGFESDLPGGSLAAQQVRVGISSLDGRPMFSLVGPASPGSAASVFLSASPLPADSTELIALPALRRRAFAADIEGRGSGPRGINALVLLAAVSLELIEGRS